ncbi:MAG TPA: acyltransferase [Verrucomicrobiae bacterium]|jgi:peptidoglycan/LPS O-acetylase OafA/YrhL|nr:acyltransferase [Verrucomicrobiae bacterium]
MTANKQSNRLTELDVLRGLAAVWVLSFHYTAYFDRLFHHDKSVPLFVSGAHAVNLFFIISGFVIYMTLAKTKRPLDFVVSRFSRLYPAYWCAVLITFLVVRTFGLPGLEVGVKDLVANLTMLQRYFGFKHVDNSYWTLSYELGFYAIMFCLFCLKALKRPLLICAIFLALQSAVIILVICKLLVVPAIISKILMLSYGHQFACGIVFYQMYKHGARNFWIHLLPLWALANEYFMPHMLYGQIDPSVTVMLAFVAAFYLFLFGYLKWICWGPLAFLGTISYTLYLIHQHIGYVVIRYGYSQGFNPFVSIGMAILVAFGLAIGITFIVEKPCLHLIRNWYRKRTELREVSPIPVAAVVEPVPTNISES